MAVGLQSYLVGGCHAECGDGLQRDTSREAGIGNTGHTLGERYGFEIQTIHKGLYADFGKSASELYRLQADATVEGIVSDTCQAVGQLDGQKFFATVEGAKPDGRDSFGNGDAGEQ